ncbi:hypothetical protein [Dysgonomonas sp. 511]|uniref:hypothetical protein n=1 Tax=Dysgonomonas sp. 511 TaxID=2302930 RepID=UPI0013D36578|nr:hypothetical protein [Dysgonomonas sp. 511]NDV77881.1 hypothetical protein [Dysgonomonas sp. 511]
MKELELKDIAGYLPYGLKVNSKDDNDIGTITGIDLSNIIKVKYRELTFSETIFDIKPILRPMSDLYKPSLPDGKIPIVELFEMYETREFDTDKKYSVVFNAPIISCEWEVYDTIKKEEGVLRFLRKTSNMGDLVCSFRYDPELRRFSMHDDTNRKPLGIAYQIDLFNYLFENHFDIYGLIEQGLAIDINTVKI